MPSYLLSMTAFACMFLMKVAVKYGGELIDRERVHEMITSLVDQFRALPTGKWHLANLMVGGLEKMTSTLQSQMNQHPSTIGVRNGMNDRTDAVRPMPDVDGPLLDLDNDLFFDYGMSFGLSPVFRFDPAAMNLNGQTPQMHDFSDVDFHMRPQS